MPKRGKGRTYKRGPYKTHTLKCPDCGFSFTYGPSRRATARRVPKRKSAKRVANGKKIAASLERVTEENIALYPGQKVGQFIKRESAEISTSRKRKTAPSSRVPYAIRFRPKPLSYTHERFLPE